MFKRLFFRTTMSEQSGNPPAGNNSGNNPGNNPGNNNRRPNNNRRRHNNNRPQGQSAGQAQGQGQNPNQNRQASAPGQQGAGQNQNRPQGQNNQQQNRPAQQNRPQGQNQGPGGGQNRRPNHNNNRNRPRPENRPQGGQQQGGGGFNFERIYEKYLNLLDQHIIARRKYHDLFYRADPNQKNKLEKNFYNTLNDIRDFESKLAPDVKTMFEKRNNGLSLDRTYTSNHEIPVEGDPVPEDLPPAEPHYLQSQKNADYADDKEESVGTAEDYLKYKGL
jgi:hypothetical protein